MRFLPLLLVACGPATEPIPFAASENRAGVVLRMAADKDPAGILVETSDGLRLNRMSLVTGFTRTDLSPSGRPDDFSLAAHGLEFRFCDERAQTIRCGVPGQPPTFEVSGRHPVIVHGLKGWVVAWDSAAGTMLKPLDGDAPAVQAFASGGRPLLTATLNGFAVVGGAPLRLQRFDVDLKASGNPTFLSPPPERAGSTRDHILWFDGHVAATPATAVVSLQVPFGAYVFLIEGERVEKRVALNGGGQAGVEIVLLLNPIFSNRSAIDAVWRNGAGIHGVPDVGRADHAKLLEKEINEQTTGGAVGYVFIDGAPTTAALTPLGELEFPTGPIMHYDR